MAELEPTRGSPRLQAALLALGLAILLAAGLGGSGAISSSMDQLAASAGRAREQADVAESVLLALQTAESSQRGFLLTGRPAYLGPYGEAKDEIGLRLQELAALAQGTPWMQDDAARLADIAAHKMDELGRSLELAQTEGRDAALTVVLTDAGRVQMEAARAVSERISARADAERVTRAAALRRSQRALELASGLATVLGVVLLGITGLSLIRNRIAFLRARDGERLEAARLHAAIEHLRDGVAVFDAEGRLTLQNARFAPTLGLPHDDVAPGTKLATLAAQVAMEPPVLAAARPGEQATVAEIRHGARVLEIWRSAMPQGGEMLAVADVTSRVEAEAIARQAQKMDIVGQMTGGIAHDFNNLLQVISANLELTMARLRRSGAELAVLDRLEAANAGVARGARLTRHLLAFARRQQLAPEAIDPARLLLSLEDMLRRTLGEAVELKLVIGAGMWAMRADPTQMESALLNLALNARDAMAGEGQVASGQVASGQVTVEVANISLEQQAVRTHDELVPGDYVMFALSDTGSGMSPEQLARAMEPFYTTKPEGKGTGLGLAMVFGFAKQSGGHFQLSSEPGRGTTARLYIPRTTAAVEPAPPSLPRSHESTGELVLLVEDDADVRRVAAATIRSLGYAVHEAGNGDGALALLAAGLKPALLFTDVVMPGSIGSRELALQARGLVPGLAILFTSGYAQEPLVEEGLLRHDLHLLSKPWRTEELAQALRTALRSPLRPRSGAERRRVLLVEDEALVRMTTADVLTDLGFDVVEAESAAAALARLDPAPDLLITDLGLPDMDGIQLIAQARKEVPGLRVVVASGRTDAPQADVVCLTKPYDGQDLRAAVEAALEGVESMSEA